MSHPQPESGTEDLSRFSIKGAIPVKAVLADMMRHDPNVRLFQQNDYSRSFVSRLLRVAAEGIRLEFKASDSEGRALSAAGVVVVGFIGSIKIQFACADVELEGTNEAASLRCPLPEEVFRIQRREAFRVNPPVRRPVECVVRPTLGAEIRYRVHDVSVSGVALISSVATTAVVEGEIWRNCRLEIPNYSPIAFDLLIRSIKPDGPGKSSSKRIGCEFHRPSADAQRAIQVYVMEIERQQRSRGPAITRS